MTRDCLHSFHRKIILTQYLNFLFALFLSVFDKLDRSIKKYFLTSLSTSNKAKMY
jgi:hypothetical protein